MNFLRWAKTQWDRVGAVVLVALGGLAVVLGWVGVAAEPLTAKQIPYIVSGGVGGLFLLGLGAMLWVSADLRDEWRKLDAIERQGAQQQGAQTPGVGDPLAADDPFRGPLATEPAAAGAGEEPASEPQRRRPVRARA